MTKSRCSQECPTSFVTNKDFNDGCYTQCNNFMCSYSNGKCADNSKNDQDSEYCYNGKFPSEIPSYSVCKNFASFSCCSEEENDVVTSKFSRIINLNNRTISQKCYNLLLSVLCAPCSGFNKDYVEEGKINYCDSLVSE